MNQYDYDVIVAGGGPAGSSAANFLRQKGRTVLVLERAKFPRFHLGESMLPFSNDVWKELGVFEYIDANYIHKPGARFIHEASGAEFTYYFDTAIRPGRPYAYQVKRADFDNMLLNRARELGAEVREETRVTDVKFAADGVTVSAMGPDQKAYTVTAQMFVDATGRDALMCQKLQLKIPDDVITTNVAVNCTFRNVPRQEGPDGGNIDLGLFDGGWWWKIPFNDGDTSVGIVLEKNFTKINRGLSPHEMFYAALKELPHLSKFLEKAEPTMAVGSEGNWSYRSKQFYGDRMLLVGDAAAFVDPLFSTGVLLGINGAKFASEFIDQAIIDQRFEAERFKAYQDKCIAGMDLFKSLVHEFYSASLRGLLMTSAVNPTVCSVITSMLAGDVYNQALWHSIVKTGFSTNIPAKLLQGGAPTSSREVKTEMPA